MENTMAMEVIGLDVGISNFTGVHNFPRKWDSNTRCHCKLRTNAEEAQRKAKTKQFRENELGRSNCLF